MGLFKKKCRTAPRNTPEAVQPDPQRFDVLSVMQYPCAHVMLVSYPNCTNFEGRKVLVYLGKYQPTLTNRDPHFSEGADSPIARFKPDTTGIKLAHIFAEECL